MMRRQLDDVRARGEALAMLTASEPGIYGRFGYGIATLKLSAEIDTAQVRLTVPEGTDEVVLRRADPREALKVCEEVYARQVAGRPGMLVRAPGWEEQGLLDPPGNRAGARRSSAYWPSGTVRWWGTRATAPIPPGGWAGPTGR